MKIENFNNFKRKRILEKSSSIDAESIHTDAMMEAWSSKEIMPLIKEADRNSDRAWYKSFIQDFYKIYNISIDKITDEDFVISNQPMDMFKGIVRNTLVKQSRSHLFPEGRKYLAIFINDDKSLEADAKEDINELNRGLVDAGLTEEEIESLSDTNKDVARFKKEFFEITKNKEVKLTFEQAQHIFTLYDGVRKLKTPVITAIVMGGHVVLHGFEMISGETQAKRRFANIPWAQDRYGVMNSPTLVNRYFGLAFANKDLSKHLIPTSTTKVYYVDVEKLVEKYSLGDKLQVRAEYKMNNPAFMTDADFKEILQKKIAAFKRGNVDPEAVMAMFSATVKAFNTAYMDSIKNLGNENSDRILDSKIKIGNNQIDGAENIMSKFTVLLREYRKIYVEYMDFIKRLSEEDKEKYSSNSNSITLSTKERQIADQFNGYNNQLVDYKEKAVDLYTQMNELGIKYTKAEEKLFQAALHR